MLRLYPEPRGARHRFSLSIVCHPERSDGPAFPDPPQSPATKSFTICTSAKSTPNPFRMRTSKTQDLKPFRICTYEKRGEGGPRLPRGPSPEERACSRSPRRKRDKKKEVPSSRRAPL